MYLQIQTLIVKAVRMIIHKLTLWYHMPWAWSDGQSFLVFRRSCQNIIFT